VEQAVAAAPAWEPVQAATPEPARLYALVCIALFLHVPDQLTRRCDQCGENWPCDQVRLAYRLREGW
jgi:hypothetical protein